MKKKTYTAPVIKSESIRVGVFGSYGGHGMPPGHPRSFLSWGKVFRFRRCRR